MRHTDAECKKVAEQTTCYADHVDGVDRVFANDYSVSDSYCRIDVAAFTKKCSRCFFCEILDYQYMLDIIPSYMYRDMTKEKCAAICFTARAVLSGVEYGTECHCGSKSTVRVLSCRANSFGALTHIMKRGTPAIRV